MPLNNAKTAQKGKASVGLASARMTGHSKHQKIPISELATSRNSGPPPRTRNGDIRHPPAACCQSGGDATLETPISLPASACIYRLTCVTVLV